MEGTFVDKDGWLSVGCAGAIFDETQARLLITRGSDSGCWYLPGGRMEYGERATECCAREVLEKTGLAVAIGRLIGS
jgi:ADP-ribose pyrophosphatase YjhB (NUDIX family)